MRGRKPKPLDLRILHGKPSNEKIANIRKGLNVSKQLEAQAPEKPSWLSPAASEEWDRTIPKLDALGILNPIDHAICEAYCVAVGHLVELQQHVIDANGNVNVSILNAMTRIRTQVKQLCNELGLSPAARMRPLVSLKKTDEPGNAYEEWKSGKKK